MPREQSFFDFLEKVVYVWKNEIKSPDIQKIDYNFYSQALETIERLEEEKKNATSNIHIDAIDVILWILRYIVEDIRNTRIMKILYKWLCRNIEPQDLLREEREIIIAMDTALKSIISKAREPEFILDRYHIEEFEIDKKTERVLCISKVDLEDFVGIDLLFYRGIKKGSIILIPKENFELFREKKVKLNEVRATNKTD